MSRAGLLMAATALLTVVAVGAALVAAMNGNAAWRSLTTPLQRLHRNLVTGQRRPFVTTFRERGAPVWTHIRWNLSGPPRPPKMAEGRRVSC